MTVFTLSGTDAQQQIVRDALAACDFPFDRLLPGLKAQTGRTTIPVEWADLSRYAVGARKATDAHVHEDGDVGHPIEYREQTLGLAWTNGRVQLDLTLERNPRLAREVLLSEGAHMIDFFYTTDAERAQIDAAMHAGTTTEHGHGWFDVGAYETWAGEAFMGVFIKAFAPTVPVTLTQFVHPATDQVGAAVRKILLRESEPTPESELAPVDPLDDFPYAELDDWARRARAWWPTYGKAAARAYEAWKARHEL